MAREWSDEERRRADDDEERHYWESVEEERVAVEEKAQAKESAIESMEKWFFEQFEDPQVEMPRDSEEQRFLYPWGGPFEAGDVLHGAFGDEFEESWISAAAERIERDGTTEWAPTSHGDYYEHPEPEPEESPPTSSAVPQLTSEILDRLAALEEIVATLPTTPSSLGHNQPPEDIGLPPYREEDAQDITAAIAETRAALAHPAPAPAELNQLARRFEGVGARIGAYLAKKADLAVDEVIKNTAKAFSWTSALGLLGAIATGLMKLAQELLKS